jgi:DNA-binding NtrC family response regulator
VITDVRMPGESGLGLVAWIRRELPHLAVLITTAVAPLQEMVPYLRGGGVNLLPKPVDLEVLLSMVRNALPIGPGVVEEAEPPVPEVTVSQAKPRASTRRSVRPVRRRGVSSIDRTIVLVILVLVTAVIVAGLRLSG